MKFRGFEAVTASSLVSGFLLGGVVGTYIGSVLSDRLGARKNFARLNYLKYTGNFLHYYCRYTFLPWSL